MALTNDKPLGTENASKARSDEANRGKKSPSNPKLSAYERYLKYGELRNLKKNARKRVFRRIEKEAASITPEERRKMIDEELR